MMQKLRLSALAVGLATIFALALFVSIDSSATPSARQLLEESESTNNHQRRNFISQYDYVVVGAGPAGCSVASKLAKNSQYSVLLLEAGDAHWDDPSIEELAAYGGKNNAFLNNTATSNDGRYSWPTFLQPDKTTFGFRSLIGSGKVVGGSSAINAGMFVVGGSYVWDHYWPAAWSYSKVKSYVQSITDWVQPYQGTARTPPVVTFLKAVRNISATQQQTSSDDFFINRAAPGVGHIEDPAFPNSVNYNDVAGVNSVVAFGQWQIFEHKINDTYFQRVYGGDLLNSTVLNRATGRGIGAYSSLTLTTGATASRIIFVNFGGKPKAVGLEYIRNGLLNYVAVNKEIILTAGTFFSPGILQRSGVGNFNRLTTLGVTPLVYNNPLVGANFRNHYSPLTTVIGTGNTQDVADFFTTFNGATPGYPYLRAGGFATYHSLDPNRPASSNASPRKYQIFVTAQQIVVSPNIVQQFNLASSSANSLSLIADNINFDAFGVVEIAHPTDPTVIPNMLYNVFPAYTFDASKTADSQFVNAAAFEKNSISSLLGLNILYQTVQQMNAQLAADGKNVTLRFGMPLDSDLAAFDAGIKALGKTWYQSIWSWNPNANKALYTAANNILNVMRASAHLDSHQNGSNKIGDVVDDNLKVIGVNGVRVADLSVAAAPPGGNTAFTAYVIGSRCADLITSGN